jgi:hypothetical protein
VNTLRAGLIVALAIVLGTTAARAQDEAPPTGADDDAAPDGLDGAPAPAEEPAAVQPELEPEPEPAPPAAPAEDDLPLTDAPRVRRDGGGEAEARVRQTVLPPWFDHQQGDERMRALFPFYFSTTSPRVSTLLIPPYYQRRDRRGWNTDVLFPFVWSYRRPDPKGSLLVIPPFYTNTADNGWDLGLAPLFFAGRTGDSHYVMVPPLLWSFWDDDSSFTLAGPLYIRDTPTSKAWGLPPILFFGESEGSVYRVALPLYFHFSNEDAGTGTTVVGPFYNQYGPGWSSLGLFPLMNIGSGQTWSKATVLPLFHYARRGEDRLTLITPLFGYDADADSSTLVTPLYQRARGPTNLDAVAPLFWYWRRPRVGSESLLIGPWLHQSDPASRTDVVFPFFWDFETPGVSRTTAVAPLFMYSRSREDHSTSLWIAPTLQYASDPEGWAFNIHPLLYTGGSGNRRRNHQVLFPFFYRFEDDAGPDTVLFPFVWDFVDRPTRGHDLVLFPFFWQFRSRDGYTQVLLNSVYTEGRCARGGQSWRFDFIPLFAFGAPCPGDVYWSILYGLAGYRTAGSYRKMELFWLPFDLSPSGTRSRDPEVALARD